MELLNPPFNFPTRSPFSSSCQLFLSTLRSTKPPKFHHLFFTSRNHFRSPLLPLSSSRSLRVSAHFTRPYRRRNSLREKLNHEQQVSQMTSTLPSTTSDSQNPNLSFDDSKEILALDEELGVASVSLKPNQTDSVLLSRLENWVDQHKNDAAYWGVGSSPIFTVFHDLEGNVKQVEVNEDEIWERNELEEEDSAQVLSKILNAKELARRMEKGLDAIPRNSSVAKFVALEGKREPSLVGTIRDVVVHPHFVPAGKLVLFGLVAAWALKRLLTFEHKEPEYLQFEKEMMRRKLKQRKEKEALEVFVVEGPEKARIEEVKRPKLDKQELMRNIFEANAGNGKLVIVDDTSAEVDLRIQEIQAMARKAHKTEEEEQSMTEKVSAGNHVFDVESFDAQDASKVRVKESSEELDAEPSEESMVIQGSMMSKGGDLEDMVNGGMTFSLKFQEEEERYAERDLSKPSLSNRSFVPKPRVITSVKEAREFLSNRRSEDVWKSQVDSLSTSRDDNEDPITIRGERSHASELHVNGSEPSTSRVTSSSFSVGNLQSSPGDNFFFTRNGDDSKEIEAQKHFNSSNDFDNHNGSMEEVPTWLEKNSNDIEPIFRKIGDGFRDSFKVARETANGNTNRSLDSLKLEYLQEGDGELNWMKDECLRDIVFRVRDNELSGRDPFHKIEAEDKHKFFEGLEKKVERENEKLLKVHEYLHANIENLDYGADGISVYDPPEKIIPRWKGPLIEKNPEFLENVIERQRDTLRNGKDATKEDELRKSSESELAKNADPSSVLRKLTGKKDPKAPKIVIEGSDGSARPGKKSGKEFWQHTKKWSRGFLDSYSAETDPEMKSVMKDIGKDLDRWTTEEEIQEAADMMTKLPERTKEFLEKKINKLKREMELYGPQAVVSKYREYAEDKEEDFLWWLDLPHVLCIELYTTENGEERIGFYSLEMAADLELEPKPCHVIAFEDAHDCRNLCYIIQAHLEMLGAGHAFVVPRPPKDAFREAKGNGFSVTVIRKGQLQMDIDQPLEEVEEAITEIGSKIYYDKLTQEQRVDMNSLMNGVFGMNDQTAKNLRKGMNKRKSKKKPTKK